MSAPRTKKLIAKEPPPPAWRGDLDKLMQSSTLKQVDNTYKNKPTVCHGRVANLQEMVPEQWWKTIFSDAMYLKTDGDVVEDPAITREELQELVKYPDVEKIFLKGSDIGIHDLVTEAPGRILDLCCGQGRHSLQLVHEYPHLLVHGHDQSSYLISLAQERAAFQNVTSQTFFTVGDCRQIPYPDNYFDLVLLLGNSFGYFSNDDQDRVVLREIVRVLQPGGRLVLDLTDGEYMRLNFAEKSWEWVDDTTFVCRERQLSKDSTRLNSREIITITNKGVVRDQFYQERLYSRQDLCGLIAEAGMEVVVRDSSLSDILTTTQKLSKRNEDLGMMEQRMVVTAIKPTNANQNNIEKTVVGIDITQKPIKDTKQPKNGITVLLGDPSLPCIGKLNNTWNNEDFLTRNRLIEALDSQGYTVKVIDRHEHMLATLLKDKPDFVFNLCDEGWNNDALKELHVPALLEMFSIPYSGAGPNCLAFCYDKGLVNRSAAAIGIDTPVEIAYISANCTLAQLVEKVQQIGYPAFVKPVKGDNSLGITQRSIVYSAAELVDYVNELHTSGLPDVLVQEYLSGNEYGVGMIGNTETGFHFLPIIQVDYSKIVEKKLPPILGYESKWDPQSPYWTDISFNRSKLSLKQEELLKQQCIRLWKRFDCRDYARFDFRADSAGVIKLLEVNPNPGWCWDGKLAFMAKLEGMDYGQLLDKVIKSARKRLAV